MSLLVLRKQLFECFGLENVHLLFCTISLIPSSKFQVPIRRIPTDEA